MSHLNEQREAFVVLWHGAQVRKYTHEPYWHHCREVAQIVETVSDDQDLITACWLHDVVEDTPCTLQQVENAFGIAVATLVEEVTDIYTSDKYPGANRSLRKHWEMLRLATVSPSAQTLKLADLISNTRSITAHDPGFSQVYLQEKRALLRVLTKGDQLLWQQARDLAAENI